MPMKFLLMLLAVTLFAAMPIFSQTPAIEPGVSHDLAMWRAARYSDVRYKLNLTLEKMSPVLKGTIEIRVNVGARTLLSKDGAGTLLSPTPPGGVPEAIILDWRKIRGHEELSTVSHASINGKTVQQFSPQGGDGDKSVPAPFEESNDHLIFRDGVVGGENVIKLDFTSPILTSGSAITRYLDKEDGSEYLYSLFVPSDASTAFPVLDQPDLKARFTLNMSTPDDWRVISNTAHSEQPVGAPPEFTKMPSGSRNYEFVQTKPISTYVFAFAVGPWGQFSDIEKEYGMIEKSDAPVETHIYVRKSQYIKFSQQHGSRVFRLTREAVKYLESYFDYKFPWPKYDLVLIPEFPFGGMEHAGATFVRESSIIFPTEPTKSDYINRATLIFHETAHQWFGDTVTMKWFDDLWLKEGFANFMAYKALEKIMPEMNAWKVFYERIKQPAYATDSTKGTTPIYQPIANLSAAKSAYGNIVYNKAPAFLRQAEFYLGEDKFQTAVRAFLKKHEFANAGWEDLVKEFETVSGQKLRIWGDSWLKQRGLSKYRAEIYRGIGVKSEGNTKVSGIGINQSNVLGDANSLDLKAKYYSRYANGTVAEDLLYFEQQHADLEVGFNFRKNEVPLFVLPNYKDYGYGIFLFDDKSRDYVLKNIGTEKDDFLRSMMWGSLWDSVREGELDPKDYVELVAKNISAEKDEGIIQSQLSRVSIAMNYYVSELEGVSSPRVSKGSTQPAANVAPSLTVGLQTRLEAVLIDRMQNAPTLGQRITFYRAFLNIASTENARNVLKGMLVATASTTPAAKPATPPNQGGELKSLPLKTKDRFDIVTRLAILGDLEAPKLLADLEKTETSDDAKRYAYAARAAFATKENREKFWNDFVTNKTISESWIEAAIGPFNSIRHDDLSLPYLQRALAELPNLKRDRKIFFVNGWLGAFIGGQKSQEALDIVNKFLADNPNLDKDLRLKILENVDLIERAVKIRSRYSGR